MTGEKQLIALRKSGIKPKAVWVIDSDDRYSHTLAGHWHEERNIADGSFHAFIRIAAEDIPEALDLRCLNGLECHVSTDRGATRFKRLCDAIVVAGASLVVGLHEGQVFYVNNRQLTDQDHG